MTISAIPQTIDALLSAFASAGITAIDGQGATDDTSPAVVFVGLTDPDGTGIEDGATSDQTWASLGHLQRDETLQIHCLAETWTGDDAVKVPRDAAFALIQAVSNAITLDPTLGGVVLFVEAINGLTYRSIRYADGVRVDIPFTVTCRARLS